MVISILSAIIISGWNVWEYDIPQDRLWLGFGIALVLFVILESFETWLKDRRRKRIRQRILMKMKNRPSEAGERQEVC